MNIECTVEKLQKGIFQTYRVTSKNSTLPVLSCLYLKAEDSKLLIRATNLDIGVEALLPVKVTTPGETTVSADVFNAFISSLSKEEKINLKTVDGVLEITSKLNTTKITTQSTEDFPEIPHPQDSKKISIKTDDLVRGFKSTVFSASNSSIKPELGSVHVYTNESKKLVFVATDSFRLSEKTILMKDGYVFEPTLLPAKNIAEITRILSDIDSDVDIVFENNQISFVTESVFITSRTVDGTFPDYKQILPKEFSTEITLLKEDLFEALRVIDIFSNNLHQATFKVSKQDNTFQITTKNTNVGETNHTLNAAIQGDDIEITFNYKYILDCFSAISSDSITLKLNTGNKPMIISPVGDTTYLYLVMPMNT